MHNDIVVGTRSIWRGSSGSGIQQLGQDKCCTCPSHLPPLAGAGRRAGGQAGRVKDCSAPPPHRQHAAIGMP